MVDLADRLQVSRAAITKIADSLERDSLLTRTPDEEDRRVVRLRLTDGGVRRLAGAERVFEGFMYAHFWAHIEPRDTTAAARALRGVEEELGLVDGGVLP